MIKTKRKSYGNTWWGKEWVKVLESVGSDRLSRGRSLANRGYVNKIKVTKGKITASVESSGYGYGYYYSGPRSYRVSIKFEPFTKEEIKKIKEIISENSSIAVELEMGNLPQTLLEELKKENINLFPTAWGDLEKKCNCWDDEDPCKHLAAVYFMLANEIDKDPFILFQVRGLKKEDFVKVSGISVQPQEIEQNPIISKFVEVSELKPKKISINPDDFEFSYPKYDIKPLLSLLPDNPPFYNRGNFKTFLENIYNHTSSSIDKDFPLVHEEPELSERDFQLDYNKNWNDYPSGVEYSFKIVPDRNNFEQSKEEIAEELNKGGSDFPQTFKVFGFASGRLMSQRQKKVIKADYFNPVFNPETGKPKIELIRAISPTNPVFEYFLTTSSTIDYDRASDSFAFFNILSSMALGLVKANLFIPELAAESKANSFSIRYVPITNDEAIQAQIDKLKQIMPQSSCTQGEQFLSEVGITDLLSIFITYIFKDIIFSYISDPKDKIVPVFAHNTVFEPVDFNEENIAQSISGWLEKLYIGKKDISPVIRIEEGKEDNFNVFVDVINKQDSLSPIIPVSKLYESAKPKKRTKKQIIQEEEPAKEFFSRTVDEVQTEISKQLIIAGQYMPELKTIIDSKGEIIPTLTLESMSQVLISTAGIFDVLGIQIILPKELKKLAYPYLQVNAKIKKYNETGAGYLNLHEMLDFSYEVALGDKTVPFFDK